VQDTTKAADDTTKFRPAIMALLQKFNTNGPQAAPGFPAVPVLPTPSAFVSKTEPLAYERQADSMVPSTAAVLTEPNLMSHTVAAANPPRAWTEQAIPTLPSSGVPPRSAADSVSSASALSSVSSVASTWSDQSSSDSSSRPVREELPRVWQAGEGLPALRRAEMLMLIMGGGNQFWQECTISGSDQVASCPSVASLDDVKTPSDGPSPIHSNTSLESDLEMINPKDMKATCNEMFTPEDYKKVRDQIPTADTLPFPGMSMSLASLPGLSSTFDSLPDVPDFKNTRGLSSTLDSLPDVPDFRKIRGLSSTFDSLPNGPDFRNTRGKSMTLENFPGADFRVTRGKSPTLERLNEMDFMHT